MPCDSDPQDVFHVRDVKFLLCSLLFAVCQPENRPADNQSLDITKNILTHFTCIN